MNACFQGVPSVRILKVINKVVKSGKKCKKVEKMCLLLPTIYSVRKPMVNFVGEHTGKIDVKGRVPLPSQLKRQMGESEESVRFVLKKSIYKSCLELHPMESWQTMMAQLSKKLNPIFNKKHNAFLTEFSKGTIELTLDSMNRLLVPKNLMDFAGLSKDVVFLGVEGIVEVWDKSRYEASKMPQDDFEQLAGEIFGDDFKLYE